MLNYIAISWVNFWVFGVWTEGGFQMSPKFPETRLAAAFVRVCIEHSALSRADDACRSVAGYCCSDRFVVHCLSQPLGL